MNNCDKLIRSSLLNSAFKRSWLVFFLNESYFKKLSDKLEVVTSNVGSQLNFFREKCFR